MKDRVDRAVEVIAGYCSKQVNCKKCRFSDKENNCFFMSDNEVVPMEWKEELEKFKRREK